MMKIKARDLKQMELLKQENSQLQKDLDQVVGESVSIVTLLANLRWELWKHHADMNDDKTTKDECASYDVAYGDAVKFLNGPLVQSWRERQGKEGA